MRNKKTSKLTKINVFDFAIVVIIIALVVCTYLNVFRQKISMLGTDSQKAYISLTASKDDVDTILSSLDKGDKFYFSDTNEYFGSVNKVEDIYESKYVDQKNTDKKIKVLTDNVSQKRIVLESKIKSNNDGVFVNGNIFITKGFDVKLSDSDEISILFNIESIIVE